VPKAPSDEAKIWIRHFSRGERNTQMPDDKSEQQHDLYHPAEGI
jgi:hypothetical protein